jgi:glycosyltransferase involved in cell wall biosynthesis
MSKRTVNLIASEKNKRADLFERVINDLDEYKIKKEKNINLDTNYHVFFNFSGIQNKKADILSNLFELRNKGLYTIFDISTEDFMKDKDADYYLLFASACSFVTCSSESIQEQLYDLTGRLAYLVHNPIAAIEFLACEDFTGGNPDILWYGQTKDVMSVRPYLTSNTYNIRVATTAPISHTKDRASTAIINNPKNKRKALDAADIVFLPPTFTREGELRRYKKVEESIISGKYVIAPRLEYDWENLAHNEELDQAVEYYITNPIDAGATVRTKQESLKTKYSIDNVKESLKSSLELATEEPIFADTFDYPSDENGFFLT